MNLSLWVLDTTWHSEIVSPHKPPSDSQCILAPVDAIVITMSSNQFNIWYCPCWYDELWLHPASWPVGNIDLTSVPCFFLIISQVYSWQTPSKHTLSSLWVSLHISRCVVITGSRCGWKSIARLFPLSGWNTWFFLQEIQKTATQVQIKIHLLKTDDKNIQRVWIIDW